MYNKGIPLAKRMIPKDFDEFFGQENILGEGKPLRVAIENDAIVSLIIYGPPGSGKTSLANIIQNRTKSEFIILNAVTAKLEDIRNAILISEKNKEKNKKTLVFIDEIHRFNRIQQDALLPALENGVFILFGATTENPFFSLNKALISRSKVYRFDALRDEDIRKIIFFALKNEERGLGKYNIKVEEKVIDEIIKLSGGDSRKALNELELCFLTALNQKLETINLELLKEILQSSKIDYDSYGDKHYDVISAFIKSIRGSDPHSAIYWLALMLEAGEDILFIARRLIILAAEDIGLADPQALILANSTYEAISKIGMPEARIILAEAVIYLATAPKSNTAIMAIDDACNDVRNGLIEEVPLHLRNKNFKTENYVEAAKYLYPHDYEGHYVVQKYKESNKKYYFPTENGYEKKIREYGNYLKSLRKKNVE